MMRRDQRRLDHMETQIDFHKGMMWFNGAMIVLCLIGIVCLWVAALSK